LSAFGRTVTRLCTKRLEFCAPDRRASDGDHRRSSEAGLFAARHHLMVMTKEVLPNNRPRSSALAAGILYRHRDRCGENEPTYRSIISKYALLARDHWMVATARNPTSSCSRSGIHAVFVPIANLELEHEEITAAATMVKSSSALRDLPICACTSSPSLAG